MNDISLRQIAAPLGVNKASDIAQKLGAKWPPPPTIFIRTLVRCARNVQWSNYPQTQSVLPFSICTPECLEDIVAIVQNAEANSRRVHAFGSKWSFSDCAMGLDPATLCLVDTTRLNNPIQKVQQALSGGADPLVYHVEAGITIHDLYTNLDRLGLGLETMGGASGQTLAGAVSTGTHGGDYLKGPLADSILAIHLVGAGGTQYWIEPYPGITDATRVQQFVAPGIDPKNIIYDDATFDACLVSLGCMGIIFAVVLRVRNQYDLVETTTATTWRAFLETAYARLNDPNGRFLQAALDPYTGSDGNNACLVTTRVEGGSDACTCAQGDLNGAILNLAKDLLAANAGSVVVAAATTLVNIIQGNGGLGSVNQALVTLVNAILQHAPDLRSVLTMDYGSIMSAVWPPAVCGGKSFCVMDTNLRKVGVNAQPPDPPATPVDSIEMFFPATDTLPGHLPWADFLGAVINAVNAATNTFLTGYIGIRFMGRTRACLGMQQWNQTCSVEISTLGGVQGQRALLTNILDLMYQFGGLPHWGQLLDLNIQGRGSLYPRYQEWREVYGRMSNNFANRTFENALSVRWQLTTL